MQSLKNPEIKFSLLFRISTYLLYQFNK